MAALVLLGACQPFAGGAESTGEPAPDTTTGLEPSSVDGTSSAGTGEPGTSSMSSSSSGAVADASSSGAGSEDSSTGEPMDEPLGPFDPPSAAAALNTAANEDDPTLTGDLLEIYFNTNRTGSEDVFFSTRDSVSEEWDAPLPVDVLNSDDAETYPEVSADGLLLLVASDRLVDGDLDVYYAYRSDRDAAWSAPLPLSGAATPGFIDWGATPTPDLSRVFLCRERDGGLGQSDIWVASADFDAWTVEAPAHVGSLATEVAECSSTLSPSEREIFFETMRPEGTSWGIWMATRPDPTAEWDAPVAVEELEAGVDEMDPWLSPDRRTLWFSRGTFGAYDLYETTRR